MVNDNWIERARARGKLLAPTPEEAAALVAGMIAELVTIGMPPEPPFRAQRSHELGRLGARAAHDGHYGRGQTSIDIASMPPPVLPPEDAPYVEPVAYATAIDSAGVLVGAAAVAVIEEWLAIQHNL